MHLRSLVWMVVVGLIASHHGWCEGRADLDAAFFATFGQPAPFLRLIKQPARDTAGSPKPEGGDSDALDVAPERLVPLGASNYALVSYETDRNVAHLSQGAVAVSYLKRVAAGWRLKGLWPELLSSGVGGQPANAGAELHRFGGDPLFMARSEWCGMGECSDWIGVIRLAPNRPVAYDDVLAGAMSPTDGSPPIDYPGNTCRNYGVSAQVAPPARAGSLFSIRYDGWTSPPGALSPKKPLHLSTSYVPDGAKLVMQPNVPVPTCGR